MEPEVYISRCYGMQKAPLGDSRQESTGLPRSHLIAFVLLHADEIWSSSSPSNFSQNLVPEPPDSES